MGARENFVSMANSDALSGIEPAVLAHIEREMHISRDALAVDCSVHAREDGGALVTIAAAKRRHVASLVEVAAAAGIPLGGIDSDAAAALRAMRCGAEAELGTSAHYAI